MTTTDIVKRANIGDIRTSGMDLNTELLTNCIPYYFADIDAQIGDVWWRRRFDTVNVTAGNNEGALPPDFAWAKIVAIRGTGSRALTGLTYIGDKENDMMIAAMNIASPVVGSTEVVPSGYWIEPDDITGSPLLKLTSIVTAATVIGVLFKRQVPISNLGDGAGLPGRPLTDLNPYIPPQFQFPLVHLLRAVCIKESTGIDDDRYSTERSEYDAWVKRLKGAAGMKEAGSRSKVVSAR